MNAMFMFSCIMSHQLIRLKNLMILLLLVLMTEHTAAQAFNHPGIFHTQEDFDRMKAKVNAGAQPWKAGYDALASNPYAQLSWTPRPLDTITRGGTGDNVAQMYKNVAQMYKDVAAAYQHAVRWKITGDSAHGNKARDILNAWSDIHKYLTGNADRYLASGLFGYQFANAAEIMRDYPGFDLTRFQNYMLNVFYYPLGERFLIGNQYG